VALGLDPPGFTTDRRHRTDKQTDSEIN